MCNLFAVRSSADEIASHFGVTAPVTADVRVETIPRSPGLVVRPSGERRVIQSMGWGFPRMTAEMRAKELAPTAVNLVANLVSPMWEPVIRDARYRCLIPLTHFAEPDGHPGSKTRTWFSMKDGSITAWAGFCRNTPAWGPVFAGMTTDSNEAVTELNPRMPVLLGPDDYDHWFHADVRDVIAFQFRKRPASDLTRENTDELWLKRERKPEPQMALGIWYPVASPGIPPHPSVIVRRERPDDHPAKHRSHQTVLSDVPRGTAFVDMMHEIDARLARDGVEIPNRSFEALGEVSTRFGISIPMGGAADWLAPDLKANAKVGDAVHQWYKDTYGDRLKVDMCPGRTVVEVDGDLFTLRVPRIFGQVRFLLAREFIPETAISRGPAICNIVQLLDDISPQKAARLSDGALSAIDFAFHRALHASYTLECTQHELMAIARGDVATAIANLMDQGARDGESKWASLQAAEKIMKAAIALAGGVFPRTHDLERLRRELTKLGIAPDVETLIRSIQCDPGIRYGEEPCTRWEALAAHRASLDLVNVLRAAGARFELGLG